MPSNLSQFANGNNAEKYSVFIDHTYKSPTNQELRTKTMQFDFMMMNFFLKRLFQ